MKEKILIIGGQGQIGKELAQRVAGIDRDKEIIFIEDPKDIKNFDGFMMEESAIKSMPLTLNAEITTTGDYERESSRSNRRKKNKKKKLKNKKL